MAKRHPKPVKTCTDERVSKEKRLPSFTAPLVETTREVYDCGAFKNDRLLFSPVYYYEYLSDSIFEYVVTRVFVRMVLIIKDGRPERLLMESHQGKGFKTAVEAFTYRGNWLALRAKQHQELAAMFTAAANKYETVEAMIQRVK